MIYDFDFRFIIHKSKIITYVQITKIGIKIKNQNHYFLFLIFNS